jgi:hypothetical protein
MNLQDFWQAVSGSLQLLTFSTWQHNIGCILLLRDCFVVHSAMYFVTATNHAVPDAAQVDGQIASIQSTLDRRLSSMPPSARQAYSELLAEQATLLAEAGQFEERLAELHGALAAAEGELGRNTFKQRALELQVRASSAAVAQPRLGKCTRSCMGALRSGSGDVRSQLICRARSDACVVFSSAIHLLLSTRDDGLQEQLKLLAERKYELAAAEEAAKASPEEQREALMARVKRDNAAVERATSEAKQLQEEVRQLEAAVAAAGAGAAGGGMKSGGALLPPDTDEQGRRCAQQLRDWRVQPLQPTMAQPIKCTGFPCSASCGSHR